MNNEGKQLKGGVILTYITIGVQLLIGLIYTPVMIRLLGQSEYGLYNLASSVISYLGLLSFGFGSAYIRFFSINKKNNDEDGIAKLNGMFLIIFSVIAVLALLGGGILTYFADIVFGEKVTGNEISTARILMVMLTINLAISFPASVFTMNIRANEKYIFNNLISLLKTITSPLLKLPILLLGYGSIGMVFITVIVNIAAELVYFIYVKRKLEFKAKFNEFDFSILKELIIFSSFIFINMIIDQINWNVDKIILGRVHGTVSVAVYSLAATLNSQYLSLSTAVSGVFTTKVHLLANEEEADKKLTKLFIKVGRIQLMLIGLFLFGFVFFGKPFMEWWGGIDYIDSYYILLILIIPVTIPIIQNIGIEIRRAKNKHKVPSILMLILVGLNILNSIPLARKYGGVGAAIGTSIAIILNQIMINLYYHKRVGINILEFWRSIARILPSFIVSGIVGVIYIHYVNIYNFWLWLMGIIIFTLVYICSLWFLVMEKYEKNLFIGPIKRIFKNKKNLKGKTNEII